MIWKNNIDYRKMDSEVIRALRFPLMLAILLFHARFQPINFIDAHVQFSIVKYFDFITYSLENVGHVGVPLFFLISGYLFFYKSDKFDLASYNLKIKKRFRSLFVPYILWNSYSLILLFLAALLVPQYLSGRHNILNNFSFLELVKYFYAVDGNNPINGPLWFVRDLMVVCLFTPVLYLLLKRCRLLTLSLLGILWFFDLWEYSICGIYGFSSVSFLFFSLGAAFSLKRQPLTKWMKWGGIIISYVFLNVVDNLTRNQCELNVYIHKICILFGVLAFLTLIAIYTNHGMVKNFNRLSDFSFFLYCYHGTVVLFLKKLFLKIVDFNNELLVNVELLIYYFLIIVITVILGYWLFVGMQKFFPKFTNLLMGLR